MVTKKPNPLQEQYRAIVTAYIRAFEKKHGYQFTGWVGKDRFGEIATFIEEYYFNLSDVLYDIDNNIPKGKIFKWQDATTDANVMNWKEQKFISYRNWLKGMEY